MAKKDGNTLVTIVLIVVGLIVGTLVCSWLGIVDTNGFK